MQGDPQAQPAQEEYAAGAEQGYGYDPIVVELTNRLRVLESKQSLLGERLLVVNQNMIEEYKKLLRRIKSLDVEIKDLKNDLRNVKNILKHLTEEAKTFAKKDSLKVLEKYINMWNPLNFVSETDVKNIVKRELEELKHARKHTSHK
jgi:hypothetical protein